MDIKRPLDRIKSLLTSLPKKDIEYAQKFLDKRDFESLKMLIDSSIIRIRKNLASDNPKTEYLELDFENLQRLKLEVDGYYEQLTFSPSDWHDDKEDDDYNEEFNANFY